MKKSVMLVFFVMLAFCGCVAKYPNSFQAMEPGWASIEIRTGMTYEQAWNSVVDVIAKKFEIEMIAKDGGYLRTSWCYTWWKSGEVTAGYRVQTIVKFSADQKNVDIKTAAQYLKNQTWVVGSDTRLLETVKTDIMGVIGRTTR